MSSAQGFILAGVIISAAASIVVAVINVYQSRRIADIHVLVNDRMDKALAQIEMLKANLEAALKAAK